MKATLFIMAMLIVNLVNSQTRINESRQTNAPQYLQECDYVTRTGKLYTATVAADVTEAGTNRLITPAGTVGNPIMQAVPGGSRFTIVGETTNGDYIIYFWDWDDDDKHYLSLNYNGSKGPKRFFIYPRNTIDITSDQLLRHWAPSIGALTLPFKYRPQTGKFEKAFTIGISGGVAWRPNRINEFTVSLLGFISASAVTFDKYNTDPAANIADPSERGAVTLGASLMFQWERLQFGILGGVDMALDNEVAKWRHQGKPWLSFGLGISLFTPSEVTVAGKNK